ncbi:hypothetical protein EIP91_001988 [Steccherinum ochraceum]|uniref:Uncharacterized protein n=1 Tax=Steccherinum ochraceum TaxID=92696 RepID=A0A4R0RCW0_9APHY|nr:hypothetical protein EIP91_001988 [Steccherinum ochraceum]
MDLAARDKPTYPTYWETVRIILQDNRSDGEGHEETSPSVTIVFPWDSPDYIDTSADDAVIRTQEKPSFHFLGETTQSYYVWYGAGLTESSYSLHPEFPSSHSAPWLDRTRRNPRLPDGTLHPKVYNNMATMPRISNIISLCGAPSDTGTVKPAALSLSAGPYAPGDLHHPAIRGIADMRGSGHAEVLERPVFKMRDMDQPCGRYYPLRFPPLPPLPPTLPDDEDSPILDDNFHESLLSGIWLGSYGLFGTEVLFLQWAEAENTMNAWKITGDVQVPRGVISWHFKLGVPTILDDETRRVLGEIPSSTRAYPGKGLSSGRGFMYVALPFMHFKIV